MLFGAVFKPGPQPVEKSLRPFRRQSRARRHLLADCRKSRARGFGLKLRQQRIADVLKKPVTRLRLACARPVALRLAPLGQMLEIGPDVRKATLFKGGNHRCLGKSLRILRPLAQEPKRTGVVRTGAGRRRFKVAIRLVDDDEIGDFHDAALYPLQFVTARRRKQQQEDIRHLRHHGFGLPHPDGLDQHDVETRSFADPHSLARPARDPAQMGLTGRRANEGTGLARQAVHPGLVAEYRPTRPRRGWIDRQNGNPEPAPDKHHSEAFDEGGFSHAGCSRETDAQGFAVIRQVLYHLQRPRPMIGPPALDERDGPGERATLALRHARGQCRRIEFCPRVHVPVVRHRG